MMSTYLTQARRCASGNIGLRARHFVLAALTLFALSTTPSVHAAITAISAGNNFTCIVKDGGVQCWGRAINGVLGNATDGGYYAAPQQTIAAGSGATAVSAGSMHACAVVSGGVQCWGAGGDGKLGNGGFGNYSTPTQVTDFGAGSGATQVAAGGGHTCAIKNGAAYCWGKDSDGQLGIGAGAGSEFNTPQLVAASADGKQFTSGVTAITAGAFHTCAVGNASNTDTYCWGSNSFGQLFRTPGTPAKSTVPLLSGLASAYDGISAGAAGRYTCAHNPNSGGYSKCYGENTNGQLGNGTPGSPSFVEILPTESISAGQNHTCAVQSGGLLCWGSFAAGKLGTGQTSDSATPTAVTRYPPNTGAGVTAVTTGDLHTCAIVNGEVRCWGNNAFAQLGIFYNNVLTVNVAAGGSVASSVGGIDCGATCQTFLVLNTVVTLAAAPNPGYLFTGWSGVTCTEGSNSGSNCSFAMASNITATANFVFNPQLINFAALPDKFTTDAPFTLSAIGGASGNPVLFSSGTPSICTTGGNNGATVTLTGSAGDCTIIASQGAGFGFGTAYPVSRSFSVNPPGTTRTINASYRLGEDDAGAVIGQPAGATTTGAPGTALSRTGAPVYAAGVRGIGKAMSFDGNSRFDTPSAAQSATDNFAVETWFRANNTQDGLLAYVGTSTDNGYGPFVGGNDVGATLGNVAYLTAGPNTSTGSWTHLAGVRNSGLTQVYLNGIVVASTGSAPFAPSASTQIGARADGTSAFNGTVDEARYFTFAPGQFSLLMLNYRTLVTNRSGSGIGSVNRALEGLSCAANCSSAYPANAAVTVTAVPASGSFFAGWGGVTCNEGSASAICTVSLVNDVTAVATFSTSVVACSAGSFSVTGNLPCMLATPGNFVATAGATTQTLCAAGFTSGIGATACSPLPQVLNADGSDAATRYSAANNGTIILRYMLGLRGAALTAGTAGSNPTRNATQIASYPDSVFSQLDVDGDGHVYALTDGLMILRRLLGLSDSALTAGANLGTRLDIDVAAAIDGLKP